MLLKMFLYFLGCLWWVVFKVSLNRKTSAFLIVHVFIFSGCRFESGRADESFQRGQGGRHGAGSASQGTTTTITTTTTKF